MKCIIIEDQQPAQRILQRYITDIGGLELVATFSDALASMERLDKGDIDLLFLDIHLPKLSGIDFLRTLAHPPQVILTTAFPDYALESYDLNVVDYLLKPFSFQRFVAAVSKARARMEPQAANVEVPLRKQEIFIKSGYDHVRIQIDDILFIHSDTDYTELHLKGQKYLSNESLRHWQDELDTERFIRTHKSYVVNVEHIHKVSGNTIQLDNGYEVPIGRAYKAEFNERFIR